MTMLHYINHKQFGGTEMVKDFRNVFSILFVTLFLCSCGNKQISDSPDLNNDTPNSEILVESNTDASTDDLPVEEITTSDENSDTMMQALFVTENIPVASCENRFIVRNDSGNLYGLLNREGEIIMPCKYEKIRFRQMKSQTVLEVMSKGSYGVFDLDGTELLPCEYTNIRFSSYADECIVRTFLEREGLLGLDGTTILPIEFDKIAFGYGKVIAAGKGANEQEIGKIIAYGTDGKVVKEFPWDKGIADIVVGNGGDLFSINYLEGQNRINIEYLPIAGTAIWNESQIVRNNLFYFQDSVLHIRDMHTLQEVSIWEFPEGQNINRSDIRSVYSNLDPITGIKSFDLYVVGFTDNTPQGMGYNLRIVLGEQIDVINYEALDIKSIQYSPRSENIGEFYNDVAIIVPQGGYLYTINTKGEKLGEITKPYTDCTLLKNAAVLNNQGFYSIVDSAGNTLLSEDGYSSVKAVNVSGLYLVTDQDGKLGLINDYAEEIVPCGDIDTLESAIHKPSMKEWALESSFDTDDEIYIIDCDKGWTLYSSLNHRLLTEFKDSSNANITQYDCVSGNTGFILINEENDTTYLISFDGSSYSVYPYATIDMANHFAQ